MSHTTHTRQCVPTRPAASTRWQQLWAQAAGHGWTAAPWATALLVPPRLPEAQPWSTTIDVGKHGPVRLSGALHRAGEAPTATLVVVIHGLGGDIDSYYVRRAARAIVSLGSDCLRLNLRGADLSGDDLYHAGITEDARATLRSAALGDYRRIGLMGFSLGGHLALRYASEQPDKRLRAVAAICPPLDLELSAQDIDAVARWPYRRYLLAALKQMYAPIARRPNAPLTQRAASRIRRLREWDARVVAPRHGFASAEDYYRRASVGPHLGAIGLPALLVAARHDPMVLSRSLRPALASANSSLDVRWLERAGHVGFAPRIDLGLAAPLGLESQVAAWLLSALGTP